jgi:hypothetical protein
MDNLDSVFSELVRISRPRTGESYDEGVHSSNLLEIAQEALQKGIFDSEAFQSFSDLVQKLIEEFETPLFNNWRAHNNFCLGLFNLTKRLREQLGATTL